MFPQNIQGILELIGWTSARAQRHLLTDDDGILRVKMQWDTEKCGLAQARLIWFSVTQVDLVGLAGTPKYLEINGEIANLTTKRSLLTTANRITAAGADAGAAMAANTSYYVYASNSQATFAPSSVRGSATAPTDGYLGAGNAINWRHVGWVHTDAAVQFTDRFNVCSLFNGEPHSLALLSGSGGYQSPAAATWTALTSPTKYILLPPGWSVIGQGNIRWNHNDATRYGSFAMQINSVGVSSSFFYVAIASEDVNAPVGGSYENLTSAPIWCLVNLLMYTDAITLSVYRESCSFILALIPRNN